jgi:transcriptional regulator with XRE-family HTH domain
MLSSVKTEQREQARELRAKGWSVKQIEQSLGVARSSVSRWVRDVPLGPQERQLLITRSRLGPIIAAERKAARARDVRRSYQAEGRRFILKRNSSYAAGCMLYWAEGGKERNSLKIVNSDPELLAVFVAFLREHFAVASDRIAIRCNLFADHLDHQREIERFWLRRLDLPSSSLRRTAVNVYSKDSLKKRRNKLRFGTCELCVNSTRIVQTIYDSIQADGGFERPEWLD